MDLLDPRLGDASFNHFLSLCVSLGIGLLIGAERERSKGIGRSRHPFGIRSFTVAAWLGAVAGMISNVWILPAALLVVGILVSIAYMQGGGDDPGLTTEASMLLTFMLGALSINEMYLAAGLGVSLSGLLASRDWLHRFVKRILSQQELHDVIIFFAILMLIMPIAPNRYFGPFQAINLHEIANFVVMVIGISAVGHILKRAMGPRGGLAMGGFLSGFVSSTTVVMKMGQWSQKHPESTRLAICGAFFSNLSTLIQMHVILVVSTHLLDGRIFYPIAYGLIVSLIIPWLYWRFRSPDETPQEDDLKGGAFDLKSSILFTLIVTVLNLISTALYFWLGTKGVWLTSALAGFSDAHANISSLAALNKKGEISLQEMETAVLLAFTSNATSKILVALTFGNTIYKIHVVSGILVMIGVIWLGVWLHGF
jgi:uncharacterized membrane protein (DUF4010 family)